MFVYVYYLKVSLLNFHNSLVMFVYSIDDPKKTDHLLALDGAKERLKLFKANLLEEGSFDSVVDKCVGVFHTASPVSLAASDPQVHLIAFFFPWGKLSQLIYCSNFAVNMVIFTFLLLIVRLVLHVALINLQQLRVTCMITWFSNLWFLLCARALANISKVVMLILLKQIEFGGKKWKPNWATRVDFGEKNCQALILSSVLNKKAPKKKSYMVWFTLLVLIDSV